MVWSPLWRTVRCCPGERRFQPSHEGAGWHFPHRRACGWRWCCPTGDGSPEWGSRRDITLIVGGGYHGKSTLLKALELGVYNHVAGDGRSM